MKSESYYKKKMIISFIKMLGACLIVFGSIIVFTQWLENFLPSVFVVIINITLNIIAIIGGGYHGKITAAKENKERLNNTNCEYILNSLEVVLKMDSLDCSYDSKINLMTHCLGFVVDKIEIVRHSTVYQNNIDFFNLVKKANELNPTSDSFLQDVEDFKQLVIKEFNYTVD